MTKLKAPFLSLAATGTLGKVLTTSKHPSRTVAKRIPTHPDAQTLRQLYQRWKFRDAQFAWNSLTLSQKATYTQARYPPRMTGQQRHTREYLRALTNLSLWLTLDEPSGQTLRDISRNANHGTAFGTTSLPAIIDRGRLFDGIDDFLIVPHSPSLSSGTLDFTLMCWLSPSTSTTLHAKFGGAPPRGYYWQIHPDAPVRSQLSLADGLWRTYLVNFLHNPFDDQWHHLALSVHFADYCSLYLDARLQGTADISLTTGSLNNLLDWTFSLPAQLLLGPADDIRIYTRALSLDHIRYIAQQERYPTPS